MRSAACSPISIRAAGRICRPACSKRPPGQRQQTLAEQTDQQAVGDRELQEALGIASRDEAETKRERAAKAGGDDDLVEAGEVVGRRLGREAHVDPEDVRTSEPEETCSIMVRMMFSVL